ncbi:MAG: amidase [Thaumarchaeota archaeon]|nr:amidase [Nitrososphaerota archaeon]
MIPKSFEGIGKFQESIISGTNSIENNLSEEIQNIESYNARLNAFITLFGLDSDPIRNQESALEKFGKKSSSIDGRNRPKKRESPQLIGRFPLLGIPLTIKDNIFFSGFKTTAGSGAFQDFVPRNNGDVVDLFLSAGCVPLGKTNLHELAMGATSSSSFFGPVRNPVDSSRISGGSSGGSAVSVAMSKGAIIGLGTDTGGSVRIPAALCGVCGFKPTIGIIPTSGIFPLSATLDHAGIMTKTMADMVTAFRAIDRLQPDQKTSGLNRSASSKVKMGIPNDYFFEDCEKNVSRAFWNAIDKMRKSDQFAIEEKVTIPNYSRMSRIRRSIQVKEASWFYEELVSKPEKRALVRPDVLSFLVAGSKIWMMEYMVSSLERLEFITGMQKVFGRVDFLAMPTCLISAPRLDDVAGKEAGSIRRQLVRNTEPFNLCGFPSLSIPTNRLGSPSLPTAIQISGMSNNDLELLQAGQKIWDCLH